MIIINLNTKSHNSQKILDLASFCVSIAASPKKRAVNHTKLDIMNNFKLKLSILVVAILLVGCETHKPSTPTYASTTTSMMIFPISPNTMWDRMAQDFSFKTHHTNPRVQKFINQYSREKYYHLIKLSQQSEPYLYHVVQMLEERGLPPELALLPFIESDYKPTAISNRGAVGLWQLIAMTGKLYGLKQDQWYDGRKDVDAATKVALDHLEFLYKKFDNDWLLALAAYNAGGGRVSSAIRNNKKAGKPTDYWSLNLPQQTQYYVPKFLALVHLVKNYRTYNIDLASIPNRQYFDKVKLTKQIHLEHVAKLAEVDVKEIKKLNPGYHAHVTHPQGPHDILLPVKNISTFKTNLKTHTNSAPVASKPTTKASSTNKLGTFHTVNRGDTLYLIATKYSTTVKAIKLKNNLTSDIIRSGQKLAI